VKFLDFNYTISEFFISLLIFDVVLLTNLLSSVEQQQGFLLFRYTYLQPKQDVH